MALNFQVSERKKKTSEPQSVESAIQIFRLSVTIATYIHTLFVCAIFLILSFKCLHLVVS